MIILYFKFPFFFQVFNAKKVHTYITVDDSISGPSLSPSGSMQTLQTTAG